ncbi:MAG: hypothetical protein ACLUYK_00270 [Eggerthella lenta]
MGRTEDMRRGRILLWASLAATLAACAATLAAVSLTGWSLFQPDTRYMVAIGRWIIENGELPTADPLTLNEGLAYTCQQWPLCLAAAAVFDTFGEAGIKCAAAMLDMAAAATVWACTLDRGRTGAVHAAASAALAAVIAALCNSTPRGIDVIALCICYAAGGKWARGGRDSLLAVFPAAGLAMAQLHGALWTVAAMVPCCLVLDGRLDRYGRLKALTAAMSTVAACMLNPYGAGLLMLPFLTMGAESLKSVGIGELAPWTQAAPVQAACGCTLAAALLLFRCRVRGRSGGRVLLEAGDVLVLGTLALALANVRNELFLFASMALSLSDIQGEVAGPRARRPLALAACCTAALVAAVGCLAATVSAKTALEQSAEAAIAALEDAEADGARPSSAISTWGANSNSPLPASARHAGGALPPSSTGHGCLGRRPGVLAGDTEAIEGTGADFAVVPSGAYPALEDGLAELGFSRVHDDGTFEVYARKAAP